MARPDNSRPPLSALENAVMQVVWKHLSVTADDVRRHIETDSELKDSTVRTLLRRLEDKGYVSHHVDGRTYVYQSVVEPTSVATSAVRSIVDRFCAGSVENLLVGLVDDAVISPEQLKKLANQIVAAEKAPSGSAGRRRKKQ